MVLKVSQYRFLQKFFLSSERKNKANRYMILLADGGMIMMVRVSVGQVGIYESISNFIHDVSPVIVFLINVKNCICFLMQEEST